MPNSDYDLPAPWSVIEDSISGAAALDEALGIPGFKDVPDSEFVTHGPLKEPRTQKAKIATSRFWMRIRNDETNDEVLLRFHAPLNRPGAQISAVAFLAKDGPQRVSSNDLRGLPLSAIENAVDVYRYESDTIASLNLELSLSQHDPKKTFDPKKPIGRPRDTDNFIEKAAIQFHTLNSIFENATIAMAELNDVPLSTVQNWVAEARRKGFLAPGRTRFNDHD